MTGPTRREEVLVLIPARGGSKRIRRKNARHFLGEPAIARVIGVLNEAGFPEPIVSTEDEEIAIIAETAGARVPFRRPAHLADDHTTTVEVVRHALQELGAVGARPDVIIVVYPTAVLLSAERLQRAFAEFAASDALFLVPVIRAPQPVERALHVRPDGNLVGLFEGAEVVRTQDLAPAYFDAGQFYIGRTEAWEVDSPLGSDRARAYVIPRDEVVDIDTEEDWQLAERLAGSA